MFATKCVGFMRNNFLMGAAFGLIAPILAFLLSRFAELPLFLAAKPLSIYASAALANLLLVRYFYRNGWDRSGRGVVFVTFVGVLALIVAGWV